MDSWFLLQIKPRQESRAVENLERQGIRCFCPYIAIEKLVRGRKVVASEALFPGYLFIYLNEQSPSLTSIRSTRGVSRFVTFSGTPMPVPAGLVERLQRRMESEVDVKVSSNLPQVGEAVEILDGPFKGLNAVYCQPDGEQRAIVLITLLSQQVEASLPYGNLRKVS